MDYKIIEMNLYEAGKRVKNLNQPLMERFFDKKPFYLAGLLLIDEVYRELVNDHKKKKKEQIFKDINELARVFDVSDSNLEAFIELYIKRIFRYIVQPVMAEWKTDLVFYLSQTDMSGITANDFMVSALMYKEKESKGETYYRIKSWDEDRVKLLYVSYLFFALGNEINTYIEDDRGKKIYMLKGDTEQDRRNRILSAVNSIANALNDEPSALRDKVMDLISKRYIKKIKKEKEEFKLPSIYYRYHHIWIDENLNIKTDSWRQLLGTILEEPINMDKEWLRRKEEIKEEFEYVKALLADELIRYGQTQVSLEFLARLKQKEPQTARKFIDMLAILKKLRREYKLVSMLEEIANPEISDTTPKKNVCPKIKTLENQRLQAGQTFVQPEEGIKWAI